MGVKEESTESVILGNYHQFSFQNDSINQFSLDGLQTLLILIFVATYKKKTPGGIKFKNNKLKVEEILQ